MARFTIQRAILLFIRAKLYTNGGKAEYKNVKLHKLSL